MRQAVPIRFSADKDVARPSATLSGRVSSAQSVRRESRNSNRRPAGVPRALLEFCCEQTELSESNPEALICPRLQMSNNRFRTLEDAQLTRHTEGRSGGSSRPFPFQDKVLEFTPTADEFSLEVVRPTRRCASPLESPNGTPCASLHYSCQTVAGQRSSPEEKEWSTQLTESTELKWQWARHVVEQMAAGEGRFLSGVLTTNLTTQRGATSHWGD
ncbi:hypothetical protein EVAR_53353_1 [Eumeta japonica]|uniref:Uncharacterized protein n=1 Tax=Eumeta variegata TaxID=151549 RepID=A0A4C1YFR9_EUMVA|nr:hypothetical protein EVAR_53353_1 [Eumeta japonica]